MFSALRSRVTYANVAMTLALVFAMTGGAYAAKHYIINSIKQINPKVVKQLKGSIGVTGPAGPAGLAGLAGPTGPAGANGKDGAPGESVSVKEVKTSEAACAKLGGSSFTVGGASPTYACNGAPWTAGGFLPKGSTEEGAWVVTPVKIPAAFAVAGKGAISFGIPLETAPTLVFMGEGATPTTECPGTLNAPQAAEGFLCVYQESAFGTALTSSSAQTYGALLEFSGKFEGAPTTGSWAVTAG